MKKMTKKEQKIFGELLLKRMEELNLLMDDVFKLCRILGVKLGLVKRIKYENSK